MWRNNTETFTRPFTEHFYKAVSTPFESPRFGLCKFLQQLGCRTRGTCSDIIVRFLRHIFTSLFVLILARIFLVITIGWFGLSHIDFWNACSNSWSGRFHRRSHVKFGGNFLRSRTGRCHNGIIFAGHYICNDFVSSHSRCCNTAVVLGHCPSGWWGNGWGTRVTTAVAVVIPVISIISIIATVTVSTATTTTVTVSTATVSAFVDQVQDRICKVNIDPGSLWYICNPPKVLETPST